MLGFDSIDRWTPQQEHDFWVMFTADLARDDGATALDHLKAGFPIYVQTADTPEDMIEKRYPDGRRELVQFDSEGEHFVKALGSR